MERYMDLLKSWCDAMVEHQITQVKDERIHGALICPACGLMHGRAHGAVYPLLYMAEKTGEEKYTRCAEKLIHWSLNMKEPDGGYVNDGVCEWKGTTVFAAVCFAKAYAYGHLLKKEVREELESILRGFLSYLYEVFDSNSGNINYVAGAACALELGGKVYQREDYRIRARKYAHRMLEFVSESQLIFGEGETVRTARSKKGCVAVDIGYNLEETIPLLAEYAASAGDTYMKRRLAEIAKAHLAFVLLDGGIDGSFCTRMDKWTYWGSRTSDGCALGLFLLSEYEEEFAAAAEQNLRLLERCTHEGLLYGGPEVYEQGEPPCIHHTFTHAAGLAGVLEWMEETHDTGSFSCYSGTGESRYYPELDVYLHRFGGWRATITGYDSGEKKYCAPSGGAVSLLYHKASGPIFVSSMTRYERYEVMNTQRHMDGADTPLTVRLQKDMGLYKPNIAVTPVIREMGEIPALADIMDKEAIICKTGENTYEVCGRLTDEGKSAGGGLAGEENGIRYWKRIRFLTDRTEITYQHEGEGLSLYVPAVASVRDTVTVDGCVCRIEKETCVVTITASVQWNALCTDRIYNHVPGLHAVPLKITNVPSGTVISVEVVEKEVRGE